MTIEADGYGDVIMPYDTIKNVLRVQYVAVYEDKFMGATIVSYVDTINLWYNAQTGDPIATTTVFYANGIQAALQLKMRQTKQ